MLMKMLCFGSCNIDTVYGVPHIVQPGETLTAFKQTRFPGGKGLNQSIAIAKAGVPVFFAGCIGEDGDFLCSELVQAGVDITYLKTVKGATGHAIIQVDRKGENSIVICRGANSAVTTEYIDHVLEDFQKGDILLLQNEISNLSHLIELASARGLRIVLNPSPFTADIRSIQPESLYSVVLNENEAMQWSGMKTPQDFLTWVRENYPSLRVVLTLGKLGCVCLEQGEIFRQCAYIVDAVDTTAAGDTFTGYYVAGIYRGMKLREILEIASAASAIAVSKEGAASSIPTREIVESAMDEMLLHANVGVKR